jgi:uncharacterized protein (DUF433 family)
MSPTEVLRTERSWIQKTPAICGGEACVRDTRVPVWSLVVAQRQGDSDADLQGYFVTPLTAADVQAAWKYYEQQRAEIEADIQRNEEA